MMNGKNHHYEAKVVPITVSLGSASSEVTSFHTSMENKVDSMNTLIEALNPKFISETNSPFICNNSEADYREVSGRILEPQNIGENPSGFIYETGLNDYDYLEIKDADRKPLLDSERNELVAKIVSLPNDEFKLVFVQRSNTANSATGIAGTYTVYVPYLIAEKMAKDVGAISLEDTDIAGSSKVAPSYTESYTINSEANGTNQDVIFEASNGRQIDSVILVKAVVGSEVFILPASHYFYDASSIMLQDLSANGVVSIYDTDTVFECVFTSYTI